ncbi:MAG TPA: hypothetical protein VN238_00145 [Solirubrobacteraceae bacterium]|nr:hypothetical protein [Solirubrobacteraceae bacterium]
MGFLDKAVKIAATAKVQLDEVRDARAAAAVKPVEAAPHNEQEEEVVERAREHGAPDPRLLLLQLEAMETLGQPVGGPSLTYGDDTLGVKFEASAPGNRHWRAEVSAFHGTDDDRHFDAAAHWFGFVRDLVADDATPVPGLGDDALQRDDDLYVLAGPVLLMVAVRTPDGPDGGDRERTQALARQVVGRLLG